MMEPGDGFVLCEIPPQISMLQTKSGFTLYVDTSFEPERYANVWCKVIAVPKKIKSVSMLMDRNKRSIISPDDDMRLQVGDVVYHHFLTLKNAKKSHDRGHYWEEGSKRYAILPYASLFFAVRETKAEPAGENTWVNTEYIMLNDWVLIEPIQKKQHTETFPGYGSVIIDEEAKSDVIALVADNPFKSSEGLVASAPADSGLQPGDAIIFEKESDVPVEYELTRTLDKPYWRMKLADIIAKRTGDTVELLQDRCLIIQDDPTIGLGGYEPPVTGTIVKVGAKAKYLQAGDHVFFKRGDYTEFPHGDAMGVLVSEGAIFVKTHGQKIGLA